MATLQSLGQHPETVAIPYEQRHPPPSVVEEAEDVAAERVRTHLAANAMH
jgi:hypothetical protein